ncbi:hypothetical protein IU449_23180 [Nocardia higoensis]|uniref:Uncharacterized protein n=1 Tax=Nocardia higoensis TaxID=228599 RepID=A0ABS0DG21_9NOCA|nr:hypothetical protein [Nocardia higoensis]MBF6357415.1 hypothetical protein [Nocardia higoensis]
MGTIALGLLNLSVSSAPEADRHTLVELAAAHGCTITHVLDIDEDTFMPTTLIIDSAHKIRAATILAPSVDHFGAATKALTLACTLIVPTATIPRVRGWTPNL